MRFILFIIGLALSLDGLYCGYTGSMGVGELIIVADGVIFLLWSSFYDAAKKVRFLRFMKTLFVIVMAVFVVYSCMICAIGKFDSDKGNEDYAIVLGSPLKNNEPTETLQNRLDTTVKYLNGHPSTKVIVSGTDTETTAMRNYLIVQGIDEDRIAVTRRKTPIPPSKMRLPV